MGIISCVALGQTGAAIEYFALFTVLRGVRIIRIVRIFSEKQNLETGARQLISQNKRRYQQDGFDLDLTYVTNRVIATSFPSTGIWSLYRFVGYGDNLDFCKMKILFVNSCP